MKPRSLKILLVEDHLDTCEIMTYVLTKLNYEVAVSGTINGALTLARKERFDLYILDALLPDGSGLELCKEIRKLDPQTPVIFCSGLAYEKDRQKALDCGAQKYLVKPLDFGLLETTVNELLSSARNAHPPVVTKAAAGRAGRA